MENVYANFIITNRIFSNHTIYTTATASKCQIITAVLDLLFPNLTEAEFVIVNPAGLGVVTLLKYHKENTVKL